MKKKLLLILMVSILLSVVLWISGLLPVIHKFNTAMIEKIISLF